MTTGKTGLERRLRISGVLVLAGLVTEAATLLWSHPTAFLCFLLAGCLTAGGMLYYLYALVADRD